MAGFLVAAFCHLLERLFIGENRVADAELQAEVDSMLAVLVRVGIAEASHLEISLDVGPEVQGRRDHQRPLRVPHCGAERRRSAIHPKAMPVVLTTPQEVENWMTAPPDEALKLQRPLPDGSLRIVARGVKEDQATLP